MSQNMLVERLKFAKRELTALKTAHSRGFGLLKIYRTEYKFSDIPGISEQSYDAITTIKFSTKYEPFPFAYLEGDARYYLSGALLTSMSVEQLEYRDSGYTIVFTGRAIYSPAANLNKMVLYSTAPPVSISYNWS